MKRFWLIVLAFLLILPWGCTKYVWKHPEKPDSSLNRDKYDCEQDALARSGYFTMGKRFIIKSGPDDDAVERCLIMKHGWVKEKAKDQKSP